MLAVVMAAVIAAPPFVQVLSTPEPEVVAAAGKLRGELAADDKLKLGDEVLVISDGAHAIEGFRGATWGGLQYDMPRNGDNYLLLQGYVKQGIDWWRYKNATLNTYGVLRYKFDSEETPWNNALTPGQIHT